MRLKEAIQKINRFSKYSLSDAQKELAVNILKVAPQEQLHEWFKFVIQRVKLGFTFDAAPELDHKRIALLEELSKKNINISASDSNQKLVHKLIIGENYDALKNLVLTHRELVDFIYIDPPYNTEKSLVEGNYLTSQKIQSTTSKFIYRDKYLRTGWLNMMSERLYLAKKLLKNTDNCGGGALSLFPLMIMNRLI